VKVTQRWNFLIEVLTYLKLYNKLQLKIAVRKYVMEKLMPGFKVNCRKVRETDIYLDIS